MASPRPTTLRDSEEKSNFTKLSRLLIDGGTLALRQVFDNKHPPATLAAYLATNRPIIEAMLYPKKGKRALFKQQWETLYPPGGHPVPSSNDFDISLLFVLLKSICGLAPPSTGWDALPAEDDVSLEASLARIKYYRNIVYAHIKQTEIDQTKFEMYWDDISKAILSLGVLTLHEIDILKAAPVGEKDYLELLDNWRLSDCNIADEILGLSAQLKDQLANVNSTLLAMSSQLAGINQDKGTKNADIVKGFCNVKNHSDQQLQYFCEDCKIPACQKCITLPHFHAAHKFEDIHDKAELVKTEMRADIDLAQVRLLEILTTKEEIKEDGEFVEQQRQYAENDLVSNRKKIMEYFDKLIDENNKRAAKVREEKNKELSGACAAEEEVVKYIKDVESALNKVGPHNLELETLLKQQKEVQRIYNKPLKRSKRSVTSYQPSSQLEELFQTENVGQMHDCSTFPASCSVEGRGLEKLVKGVTTNITVNTKDCQGHLTYCAHDKILVEVKSQDGVIKEDVSVVADEKTGRYKFQFTPSAATKYEISVFVNLRAVDHNPFCVTATERHFEVVRVFGRKGKCAGEFDIPVGLLVDSKGNIAVTEHGNSRIQVFNSNGGLVSRPFGMDVLSKPWGLVYSRRGDKIIVADHAVSSIECFSISTGEHLGTAICIPNVLCPIGLSVDGNDNIIICDCGNFRIQLVSPEMQIRLLFGKKEKVSPHMCIYNEGKYYVSPNDDKTNVMVFNENGERVQDFRDKDGNVHILDHPRGLAVDKDGDMIVCEWGAHRLHVYRDGVLLASFGSHGHELGQFNHPNDVKLLPDGLLAISDTHNHRIQIIKLLF